MRNLKIALLFVLMFFCVALFAQDTTIINDLISTTDGGLTGFFVSLAALVPLVTLLAAFVNKQLNASGVVKQIIAWLISILLAFIGWYFKLGVFDGILWWVTLIYGFAIGLTANGFFDIKIIQSLLTAIGIGKKQVITK